MTAPVSPVYVGLDLRPPTAQTCSFKLPQIGSFGGPCGQPATCSVHLSFAVPGLPNASGTGALVNLCDYHLRVAGTLYEGYMQKKHTQKTKKKESP